MTSNHVIIIVVIITIIIISIIIIITYLGWGKSKRVQFAHNDWPEDAGNLYKVCNSGVSRQNSSWVRKGAGHSDR